jgi:hypothetical protein
MACECAYDVGRIGVMVSVQCESVPWSSGGRAECRRQSGRLRWWMACHQVPSGVCFALIAGREVLHDFEDIVEP